MKTCPACGLKTDDRFLYCPDDGSPLDVAKKYSVTPERPASDSAPRTSLLYCPACENEYPLTFSACPIDGLKLSKERGRFISANASSVSLSAPQPAASQPSHSYVETIDSPPGTSATAHYDSQDEAFEDIDEETERAGLISKIRSDRPSFQIAAIATMIGLALFGLVSAYRLYSFGIKRPPVQSPVASDREVQESPPSFFIETPKEAREYVEEATAQKQKGPASEPDDRAPDADRPRPEQPQSIKPPSEKTAKTKPPVAQSRPMDVSAPVLPQSTGGRVAARLVRVRASRIQPGYRYDLTFTLREMAGRPVRWDKMTVSARSSSGRNHLQTLPFYYTLKPSGLLTFTVSVEMPGRKDPDWCGRIVCTTTGKDNSG
ncbi:MAG TPA: hypothetical protein VNO14_15645, partial [Blastocatellia bacterium]|nr:hypothetical protein [Blastocatellia bacterium]